MHNTAMQHGRLFFETYLRSPEGKTIVDLGAQDVNGSLRTVAPPAANYIGVDFEAANGVDVVIDDPYSLPFEDASIDACVSSSCFEHSEFFWLSFMEALRILKPDGLLYLNVPSNGYFHRYPVDCWRFYPDSGIALQNWAQRGGLKTMMLESFIGQQKSGIWNDFVAVFLKDGRNLDLHKDRILHRFRDFTNGRLDGSPEILNHRVDAQDQRNPWATARRIIRNKLLGGFK